MHLHTHMCVCVCVCVCVYIYIYICPKFPLNLNFLDGFPQKYNI